MMALSATDRGRYAAWVRSKIRLLPGQTADQYEVCIQGLAPGRPINGRVAFVQRAFGDILDMRRNDGHEGGGRMSTWQVNAYEYEVLWVKPVGGGLIDTSHARWREIGKGPQFEDANTGLPLPSSEVGGLPDEDE